MSQGNFTGGFITGAFIGGIIGGVVGVLASNRLGQREEIDDFSQLSEEERRRLENATTEERMEIARRGLEDKIAQLNTAIEDVRVQMSNVNQQPNGFASDYPRQSASASTRQDN